MKRPSSSLAAPRLATSLSSSRSACSMRREDVAHPEDAVRHAVRVEKVEVCETLSGGRERDRPTDDLLDRQCRSPAGVSVELREDHAVEVERLVEGLRGGDGVLAGHGVDDEECVVGATASLTRRTSSMRSASIARRPAVSTMRTSRPMRRASASPLPATATGSVGSLKTGTPACCAEDPELLDRGGPLQVCADEHGIPALLAEPACELGGGRRLA